MKHQQVESGARNCIFIKTTIEHPELLVSKITSQIYETKSQKARYILRMIPILGTCKAYNENIEKLANSILSKVFTEDSKISYSILFKTRNNDKVKRDDIIKLIGKVIRELPGTTTVDLNNPDICIVVEVLRSVCCIGTAKEYYKYRKYNLVELAKDKQEEVKAEESDNK